MTPTCDNRPCILKMPYEGEDVSVVFSDAARTIPLRYRCTCEAKFAQIQAIVSLYAYAAAGHISKDAIFRGLELKIVYLDEDPTASIEVKDTEEADKFLAKFRCSP